MMVQLSWPGEIGQVSLGTLAAHKATVGTTAPCSGLQLPWYWSACNYSSFSLVREWQYYKAPSQQILVHYIFSENIVLPCDPVDWMDLVEIRVTDKVFWAAVLKASTVCHIWCCLTQLLVVTMRDFLELLMDFRFSQQWKLVFMQIAGRQFRSIPLAPSILGREMSWVCLSHLPCEKTVRWVNHGMLVGGWVWWGCRVAGDMYQNPRVCTSWTVFFFFWPTCYRG